MAHVITVTRQFGSLGRMIARQVADNLGYKYYDRDIIEMAVKEMRGDIDHLLAFDQQKITAFDKMKYPLGRGNAQAKHTLFEMEKSIMVDLALKEDCVIVGRCSDYVLRKYHVPDEQMLNVFIYAPVEKRLEACKDELGIENPGEAYSYLTKVDKAREDFYKSNTKHKFTNPKFRHLMIDSSIAGYEAVAEVIAAAARAKFGVK